jgi:glycosyltransferase involved in cell wall biosynthesis
VPNGTRLRQPGPVSHLEQWNLKPGEYVLFLGRFSPEKNCHLLIEAFEKVPGPVRLVLAGGSSHSSVYVNELRRHQSERIRFLDWVSGDALDALTTHAMLFVMPSDLEGLSLALLDAMGAGVCVLASDVPENRELVEGVGFTFRPGDVHDLQHMLQFLISDPMAREAAAGLARQRIRERYLWPGIAAQVEAVYWDVVGRPLAAMPSRGPQKKNTSAA